VNDTPWRNILTDRGCSRTVHISVRDHLGNYAKRYTVDIHARLWRSRGDFVEFASLVDQYDLTIAVSVKFASRQEIGLTQGTGNNSLDMECFGREVRQILLLPTEGRPHEASFSAPDKLVLGGYTVSGHLEKERIGEVQWQIAEVHADGTIKFSELIPVTL